jgi:hypothetical protein
MQYITQGNTNFTIRGEPLKKHTVIREDKLARLDKVTEISSLHLTGLNLGEIVTLFQRRGPHLMIRPRNVTLH